MLDRIGNNASNTVLETMIVYTKADGIVWYSTINLLSAS